MKTNRFFRLLQILIALSVFPMVLSAQVSQEDVSVEFSFKAPDEYICEIRNLTKYRMSILLSKEEGEERSALYFDIAYGAREERKIFYSLMKEESGPYRFLNLDTGQAYTISYKEGYNWKFIKAHIRLYYGVRIPNTDSKLESYYKDIDLQKIKYKNCVSME
ncbi:hypothetical protein [Proteiniphilum sp. UBA5384]|uniref:hypothetical protein n=1 Tax=Proteiniphilum sp. UBA5384 TaxID=1947279 RepID=UPI002600D744|nr:hypothetical protein [Proteiniphilum sp. UBA5384]